MVVARTWRKRRVVVPFCMRKTMFTPFRSKKWDEMPFLKDKIDNIPHRSKMRGVLSFYGGRRVGMPGFFYRFVYTNCSRKNGVCRNNIILGMKKIALCHFVVRKGLLYRCLVEKGFGCLYHFSVRKGYCTFSERERCSYTIFFVVREG